MLSFKLGTNWYFSNRAFWLIESCLGGQPSGITNISGTYVEDSTRGRKLYLSRQRRRSPLLNRKSVNWYHNAIVCRIFRSTGIKFQNRTISFITICYKYKYEPRNSFLFLLHGVCFNDGFSNPHGFGVILKNFLHNLRAIPYHIWLSRSAMFPICGACRAANEAPPNRGIFYFALVALSFCERHYFEVY